MCAWWEGAQQRVLQLPAQRVRLCPRQHQMHEVMEKQKGVLAAKKMLLKEYLKQQGGEGFQGSVEPGLGVSAQKSQKHGVLPGLLTSAMTQP